MCTSQVQAQVRVTFPIRARQRLAGTRLVELSFTRGSRGLGPDSEAVAVASEVPGEFCLSEEEEKHRSSTSVQAWHGMSHRCMGLLGGWRTEKSETPSPRAAGVLERCG